MEPGRISLEPIGQEEGAGLRVSGVLDRENAGVLGALLDEQGSIAVLDLAELDLEGPEATLAAVGAVRRLLEVHGRLTLEHAPQILAHTLYRVGLLERGGLRLREPRQEEPYG